MMADEEKTLTGTVSMDGFNYAQYVILSAMSWRKHDKQASPLAEAELIALREAVDMLDNHLMSSCLKALPPRKQP